MKSDKVIIRNAWGFTPLPSDYETPDPEDMCIPDDSFTIGQILERFAQGISPNIGHEGQYSDTEDFDEVDPFSDPDFDLSDIDRLRSDMEQTLKKSQQKSETDTSEPESEVKPTDKKADDLAELQI
nr:MAG: hypothetical protein [Microvirus sp.]